MRDAAKRPPGGYLRGCPFFPHVGGFRRPAGAPPGLARAARRSKQIWDPSGNALGRYLARERAMAECAAPRSGARLSEISGWVPPPSCQGPPLWHPPPFPVRHRAVAVGLAPQPRTVACLRGVPTLPSRARSIDFYYRRKPAAKGGGWRREGRKNHSMIKKRGPRLRRFGQFALRLSAPSLPRGRPPPRTIATTTSSTRVTSTQAQAPAPRAGLGNRSTAPEMRPGRPASMATVLLALVLLLLTHPGLKLAAGQTLLDEWNFENTLAPTVGSTSWTIQDVRSAGNVVAQYSTTAQARFFLKRAREPEGLSFEFGARARLVSEAARWGG